MTTRDWLALALLIIAVAMIGVGAFMVSLEVGLVITGFAFFATAYILGST